MTQIIVFYLLNDLKRESHQAKSKIHHDRFKTWHCKTLWNYFSGIYWPDAAQALFLLRHLSQFKIYFQYDLVIRQDKICYISKVD